MQVQDMQLQYPVQDPQSKAFYEQAAVAAASMGIVVDVYAAARGFVGLQTLEPLINSTGGALHLYPSAEEATLPQDLYRYNNSILRSVSACDTVLVQYKAIRYPVLCVWGQLLGELRLVAD
jgi:hypothetical protein